MKGNGLSAVLAKAQSIEIAKTYCSPADKSPTCILESNESYISISIVLGSILILSVVRSLRAKAMKALKIFISNLLITIIDIW